jgi:CubicO group peptidase (beta-lactamase class C family)
MTRAGARLADVPDYLEARIRGKVAAYAAAVVAGGETALAVGGERRAGSGDPVTTHSLFHICSCSKAFSALAFEKLVQAGLTSWDSRVLPTVPEFELADPWMTSHCTFRDLAGMRVGLTRDGIAEWGFRPEAPATARLGRVRAMGFEAPFRDRFCYSNLSYLALAVATGRIGGASYPDCLRRLVFSPLNLNRATLRPAAELVSPHLPIAGRMTPVPELTGDNSQGSARVHLCAEDAAKWIGAMLELCQSGSGGSSELFACQSVIRPQARFAGLSTSWGYGFGWHLADYDGRQLFTHGGGGRGWRAMALLDPGRNAGVMVMLAYDGDETEALALELLDLATGRRPTPRSKAAAAKSKQVAARQTASTVTTRACPVPDQEAVGVYEGAVTGKVRISLVDGEHYLAVDDAPAFDAKLRRTAEEAFDLAFENLAMSRLPRDPRYQLRFQRDESGRLMAEADYLGRLERVAE